MTDRLRQLAAWFRALDRTVRRRVTALVLALVSASSIFATQHDVGIARDEMVYIGYGKSYARWWIDLVTFEDGVTSKKRITDTFGGDAPTAGNREHPPLMKTLLGLSRILLADKLELTDPVSASRAATALMYAAAVVMLFLFGTHVWSYGVGLLAALLLLFLPRGYFHAQLATFDAPVVTMWLATLFAYYKALGSKRWSIGLCIVFGLALATKHNALMLPGVIGVHYAYLCWRKGGQLAADGAGLGARLGWTVRAIVHVQPWVIVALALGPLVLIAVWPWLWFDTVSHIRDWIGFHLDHVHYNFEYLGENFNHPPFPWHVVFVTTLLTVPVVTLVGAVMGSVSLVKRAIEGTSVQADRAPGLLMVLSAAVSMGVFLLPSTPIFGAEKHWAPAIPTLCLLTGIAVVQASTRCSDLLTQMRWAPPSSASFIRMGVAAALGGMVVTASLGETVTAHPHGLSHYNALAGGAPGGADLGMNRQFWGTSARGVLDFVGQFAPAKGEEPVPVYSHDAQPAWNKYPKLGLLPPGLPDAGRETAGIAKSHIALVIHERHFNRHDYLIWDRYGTVQPSFVLTHHGVPLVSVYLRENLRGKAEAESPSE